MNGNQMNVSNWVMNLIIFFHFSKWHYKKNPFNEIEIVLFWISISVEIQLWLGMMTNIQKQNKKRPFITAT